MPKAEADPSKAKAKARTKSPTTKARTKPAKKEAAPDDVVRQTPGSYLSGDGRFEIRQSATTWYLVDTTQANEFGQELMHGPFASLKEAKAAITGARDVKPLLKSTPRPTKPVAKKPPAPAPQSWIDKLPHGERREVRALIRALEHEGVKGAEDLVRRHRDDTMPTIATRLLEQRLNALIEEQPEGDREPARALAGQIVELVTAGGSGVERPAPRWALVEVRPEDERTVRRVNPRV